MERINGHVIIAQFLVPAGEGTRPGRVIIVKRQSDFQPYVCAMNWGDPFGDKLGALKEINHPAADDIVYDKDWAWGHYFEKAEDAFADFIGRVERYTGIKPSTGVLPV